MRKQTAIGQNWKRTSSYTMNLKCHNMIQSVCTNMAALENVGEIIKLPIILTKRDLRIFSKRLGRCFTNSILQIKLCVN